MIADRRSTGRLHLSDGPIDLVIKAEGNAEAVDLAYLAARRRFGGMLAELAAELKLLRRRLAGEFPSLRGPIARRMAEAAWPYRARFVTPMVAVAGAVAEAVLAAMLAAAPLKRAFVNDGGDIALHLDPGEHVDIGVVRSLASAEPEAYVRIEAGSKVRGVATSGRHGRSLSLGIADAVTVLAQTAAGADAAATMIANAVDVADPAIIRRAARELDPDSDLLDLPVTVEVRPLSEAKAAAALAAGRRRAEALIAAGLIEGALLSLAGRCESVGVERRPIVTGSDQARSGRHVLEQ
ncbi:MAG: UPF0280 family protein [Hyphomicrobiales bacterium]